MFPLKQQFAIGYHHGDPTYYSDFHLGIDILCPENTPVYAPFNGYLEKTWGNNGGLTALLNANKKIYRFLHLNSIVRTGEVKEGEIIAYTGGRKGNPNAGLSNAPHLHLDISKNQLNLNDRSNFLDPDQENWNSMINVLYLIDENLTPTLQNTSKEAIGIYKGWVNEIGFSLNPNIISIAHQFKSKEIDINFVGGISKGYIVDPEQIISIGVKEEIKLGTNFTIVCLLYNPNTINPRPTNPVHNPEFKYGYTTIQIPVDVGVENQWTDYAAVAKNLANTISHESCHAWPFIINTKSGLKLPDKTHDARSVDDKTYFNNLLNELKPHWSYLVSESQENSEMKLINDNGTVYITGKGKKAGLADPGLFNVLKQLADVETGSTAGLPQIKVIEKAKLPDLFEIKDR